MREISTTKGGSTEVQTGCSCFGFFVGLALLIFVLAAAGFCGAENAENIRKLFNG